MHNAENMNWLSQYAAGRAADFGEIGILKKIADTIGVRDLKWILEFGAGNGLSASNSRHFIHEEGYHAVLIEPMKQRFRALTTLYETNDKVTALNAYVGFSGDARLDSILAATEIPKNFDIMSVDIDGNDYHVWASLHNYRPKIVCIEFNETIPPHIDFVQPADFTINQGCGIFSLWSLGKQKGYELVCVSENNAFFVVEEYFSLFDIADNSPSRMFTDESNLTYLFVGYDGQVFLAGSKQLKWHSMAIAPSKCQQLPQLARKFPPNYNFIERFIFRLWRFKASPKAFISSFLHRGRQ